MYRKVLPFTKPRAGSALDGAEILGAHLEGPFISDQKYGAHEVATLCDATNGMADLNAVYGLDKEDPASIAIITVAPDIPGMLEVIPELSKRIPLVALGKARDHPRLTARPFARHHECR